MSSVGDGCGNRWARRTRRQLPGKCILVEVDLGSEDHTRYARDVHVVSPGIARLYSESTTTERQDRHNAGLYTGQAFVGGDRTAWWSCGAVQHVHGMGYGFHDAADRPLGDAIQLMHVGRTCRGMYSFIGEQLSELLREKLSRVIAVECADDSCRCLAAFIQQSGEASQELTYMFGRLMFVSHRVNGLKARVVVDDYESVASTPVHGR
eukprot:4263664-Pleurochrysis_carterae.AAC.1